MIKDNNFIAGKEAKKIKNKVYLNNNIKNDNKINLSFYKRNKLPSGNLSLIIFIIIFFILICLNGQIYGLPNLNFNYEIILTVKGQGKQKILNQYNFGILSNTIYVNDQQQKTLDFFAYNLIDEENIISINFNESLTNCHGMFWGRSNLIKIDFSNFDSSLITNMSCMFYDCKNLISINLNNFITSNVIDMSFMFYGCSELTSIELSNLILLF